MGYFGTIAGANASGGGTWIRDGRYKFMVEKVHLNEGHSGPCFIAELRVMEADPTGEVDEQGKPVVPNKAGSSCSLVCNLKKHESAAGNAKAFAIGVLGGLGYTPEQITEQVLTAICGPNNPLRGAVVSDQTYRKPIRTGANAGKPITLHKWESQTQTQESIKAGRAYLDGTAAVADAQPMQAPAAAPQNMPADAVGQQPPAANPLVAPAPVASASSAPAVGGMLGAFLGGQ